jgi:hypothetical protein
MKGAKFDKAGSTAIGGERFSRVGKNGPIDVSLTAHRNLQTGETRIEIEIPDAERLAIGEDLSVVLQCLGWGIANLGMSSGLMPPEAWHDCCRVVTTVEYVFRLD